MGEVPAGPGAAALGRAGRATTSTCRARSATRRSPLAAMTGRTALDADALAAARARLETPAPRVALGVALRGVATAALDVSDGLVGDLAHILERSAVGATVDLPAVPRSPALAQLMPAAPSARSRSSACSPAATTTSSASPRRARRPAASPRSRPAPALPLTRIGAITEGPGLVVRDERGVPLARAAARLRSFRVTRGPHAQLRPPALPRLRRALDHRGEALHRRLVLHPLPELPAPAARRSAARPALDPAGRVRADRRGGDRRRRGHRPHRSRSSAPARSPARCSTSGNSC